MRCLLPALLALLVPLVAHGADESQVARGRYLTRLGDCQACHTQAGHEPFSGGRAIETPFGVIYTPNITPDPATGIGAWSADDFYKAMHEGIGKNGEYLYPAFPFPSYTRLGRADVDAIRAYLRTVEPVRRHNRPDNLRWPYSWRSVMRIWRHLYFEPGAYEPDPNRSDAWNRGAYLIKGLAHCGACHTTRNRWGAKKQKLALAGSNLPIDGWLAPNITPSPHGGIGDWPAGALKRFLTTGRSERGDALGPMRDVVQSSLQYIRPDDLDAMLVYLRSVPPLDTARPARVRPASAESKQPLPGELLYHKHCSGCHGDDGRAKHEYYPDLRDNPVVLRNNPTNLVLVILRGGFQAATRDNPYPYSMPPFGFKLKDAQVAAIANYVRRNWSRRLVFPITPAQVSPLR